MKFSKNWLWLAAALLTVLAACHKDGNPTTTGSTTWPGQSVKASFVGQVLDEAGQPVAGAVVRAGSKSVETDKNGAFILRDQIVNSARAIVTATKAGFWDATRTLFVHKNGESRVVFRMLEKKTGGSFTASAGGSVAVESGVSVEFPANSISKNGAAYSGKVNLAARWLDPSDELLDLKAPGALRGLRADGSEELLTSFGMLGVELTDAAGEKLQVASGQKATISAEIAPSLLASAPQEVPLWHFSETEGIWVEEGKAVKAGTKYVGEVAHFSWWNYDMSGPAVLLTGKVVDQNGHPLDVQVIVCSPSSLGCAHGGTETDGSFEGLVAKDVPLTVSIVAWYYNGGGVNSCNNVLYEMPIGPLSADTDLGTITVDLSNPLTNNQVSCTLSGQATTCSGAPVANAYVRVEAQFQGFSYYLPPVFTDASGHFSATQLFCAGAGMPTGFVARAYDLDQSKESLAATASFSTTVDFGALSACDDLDEFVRYDLDGAGLVTLLADADSSFVSSTSAIRGQSTGQLSFYCEFQHNQAPASGLPLKNILCNGLWSPTVSGTIPVTTNLTGYPSAIGQYLTGTFGGSYTDQFGSAHTVSGSYRVKRKW